MASNKGPKVSHRTEAHAEGGASNLAKARHNSDLLSRLLGERGAGELLREGPRRPMKADRKVDQVMRLDADVLDAYRRQGADWQTRINQVLRENMPDRRK